MTIYMKDSAWVWLDLDHEFKTGEERWVVDCADCGEFTLTDTRVQAVRMANMHNAIRHPSPLGEDPVCVIGGGRIGNTHANL